MTNSKTKRAEEMVFTDSLMFRYVMRDKGLCRQVLEKVVGLKGIRDIKFLDTERSMMADIDAKGVRLDVYMKDDKEQIYTIEMQAYREKTLGKRIRYYQSVSDIELLDVGEQYQNLHRHLIIFFCNYKPFEGRDECRYEFHTLCINAPGLELGDEVRRIVISSAGDFSKEDEDVQAFLKYMNGIKVENALVDNLDEAVQKGRYSRELRRQYMYLKDYARLMAEDMAEDMAKDMAEGMAKDMAEGMAKDMAEGMAKDMAEGMAKDMAKDMVMEKKKEIVREHTMSIALSMLENGIPVEVAARVTGVTAEEIREWTDGSKTE